MEARNLQELGINLQKIVNRLMANDELIKLLYYTDADPLSESHPVLTQEQKKTEIYQELIKIVPKVGTKDNAHSMLAIYIPGASGIATNSEFKQVKINIDVYTPLTQWIIKDLNLRPFAVMGEIQKSLNGKTINGLGKIKCGDFDLRLITEDVSCYTFKIEITEYE